MNFTGSKTRIPGGDMKKSILFLVSFLAAGIVMSGVTSCGRKQTQDKQEKQIVLNHIEALMPDQLEVLKEIINEFEKKYPSIKIKLSNMPYTDYFAKLQTMIAGGVPPDVCEVRCFEFPAFAEKGILLELNPYIEKEEKKFIEDFYPLAMDMATYKGKIYGLTYDMCVFAIFYNQDLFDEAGVSYPDENWTWDTLVKTGQKLTRDINSDGRIDQFAFTGAEGGWITWCPFVWQNAGRVLDSFEDPKKCLIDQPETVEAIQFIADLINKYHCSPTAAQTEAQIGSQMFLTGKLAMALDGPWMFPVYQKAKFSWDVAPLPKHKRRANLALGSCFSVIKESKHKKEAYEYIKYLTSVESQQKLCEAGFSQPTRKSTMQTFLQAPQSPKHAEVFIDALKYARLMPKMPQWNEIDRIISSELDLVFLGKVQAKDVCKKIALKVNKLLQEK